MRQGLRKALGLKFTEDQDPPSGVSRSEGRRRIGNWTMRWEQRDATNHRLRSLHHTLDGNVTEAGEAAKMRPRQESPNGHPPTGPKTTLVSWE